MAVENWIGGDMEEATYLMALAEHHHKMSDKEFDTKYEDEE